jgi:hypothetical protein
MPVSREIGLVQNPVSFDTYRVASFEAGNDRTDRPRVALP